MSAIEYLEDIHPSYLRESNPLWWHLEGLTQTASGYGSKLTTMWMAVLPDGRKRRIYVTQYSNAGSAWVTLDGRRVYLRGF